jgi:hypothetical protein
MKHTYENWVSEPVEVMLLATSPEDIVDALQQKVDENYIEESEEVLAKLRDAFIAVNVGAMLTADQNLKVTSYSICESILMLVDQNTPIANFLVGAYTTSSTFERSWLHYQENKENAPRIITL